MHKYKVTYTASFEVKAKNKQEAEEEANKIFDEDVEKAIQETGAADIFSTETKRIY